MNVQINLHGMNKKGNDDTKLISSIKQAYVSMLFLRPALQKCIHLSNLIKKLLPTDHVSSAYQLVFFSGRS
jgi:hypothetical protein